MVQEVLCSSPGPEDVLILSRWRTELQMIFFVNACRAYHLAACSATDFFSPDIVRTSKFSTSVMRSQRHLPSSVTTACCFYSHPVSWPVASPSHPNSASSCHLPPSQLLRATCLQFSLWNTFPRFSSSSILFSSRFLHPVYTPVSL